MNLLTLNDFTANRAFGGIEIDFFTAPTPAKVAKLPFGHDTQPGGITFDGNNFCITIPQECIIYRLDKFFAISGSVHVDKPYGAICFDTKAKIFWAATDSQAGTLFKLNRNFECIGRLDIGKYTGSIRGLAYNCEKNVLLAVQQGSIAEIAVKTGHMRILGDGDFNAVSSLAPYYAAIQHRAPQANDRGSEIIVYNEKGRPVKNILIPGRYTIWDALFYLCASDRPEILLMATERCDGPVIMRYDINTCDIAPDYCNYMLCKKKPTPCSKSCSELLDSVAQIETAMAHMLMQESKKLHKAVDVAASIDELLEINSSVSQIIDDTALLEHILIGKLRIIERICQGAKEA